ncbi:MAG: hypothetical protein MUE85_17955 [Microscillaceae bacterium]|jgi:hypothetical protein|nr:hypothetical protein [Microscillaceae bacterium]
MNLQKYQHLLAKIYTDADFRRRFFAEPVRIGAEFDLEEALALDLAQKHQQAIDFYSDTLLRKRRQAIKSLLPQTSQILDNQLNTLFETFAQNRPLLREDRYAEDSFAFGKYLAKTTLFEQLTQAQQEKIIFETLQIRLEKPYFYFRRFRFHPLSTTDQSSKGVFYLHFHCWKWYYVRWF